VDVAVSVGSAINELRAVGGKVHGVDAEGDLQKKRLTYFTRARRHGSTHRWGFMRWRDHCLSRKTKMLFVDPQCFAGNCKCGLSYGSVRVKRQCESRGLT
jgi:hypothetical protein